MNWKFLDPKTTLADLGLIPGFLSEDDPRPASEQVDSNYKKASEWNRWRSLEGFTLNPDTLALAYPLDPDMLPIAMTQFRDETIVVYPDAWILILQKDGLFEVARVN